MSKDKILNIIKNDNEPFFSDKDGIVISSRIRLARNIKTYSFPEFETDENLEKIFENISQNAILTEKFKDANIIKISELTDNQKKFISELRFASPELISSKKPSAVIISKDKSISLMINEEDHIRLQVMKKGFCLNQLWKCANQIDDDLSQVLDLSWHNKYGFLTACPTNLGTAMRASVMLFLPALFLCDLLEPVVRGLSHFGIVARGMYGEGSTQEGSIFQISNQRTLGKTEEEILDNLNFCIKNIIKFESNARKKLFQDKKLFVFDKIGRALGTLQNSYILSNSEALNCLSIVKLASLLRLLDKDQDFDFLFTNIQQAHLQIKEKKHLTSSQIDEKRARFLRENLKDIQLKNL